MCRLIAEGLVEESNISHHHPGAEPSRLQSLLALLRHVCRPPATVDATTLKEEDSIVGLGGGLTHFRYSIIIAYCYVVCDAKH